jgi:hypothetical protein
MIYNKEFFIDVRFKVDASSKAEAIRWLEEELRHHNDSDVIESWLLLNIDEDEEFEEIDYENV